MVYPSSVREGIICYGLSGCISGNEIGIHISKHHMLWFITNGAHKTRPQNPISKHHMLWFILISEIADVLIMHFKTSYVMVYHGGKTDVLRKEIFQNIICYGLSCERWRD